MPTQIQAQRATYRSLLALCLVASLGVVNSSIASYAAESEWVKTGETGRLIYIPDAEGDRILDFSNVGYRGRGVQQLPTSVPNVVTVSPIAGDDTAQIQAAINQVAAMPIGPDGYRGAVLLQPGTFDINTQLQIRASGIVLRGSGNSTVLHGRNPLTGGGTPNQRPLIRIYGNGNRTDVGSTQSMIDKVVPAGATSFRVNSTSGFAVGDMIRIDRPSTANWIEDIGMDDPPDGDPAWEPGSMNIRYHRTITRIEGNRIFIDAPLANSFELQYGGGTIREYTWSGAIQNIGVENLRGDSDFDSPIDENHAWEFIAIGEGQNSNRAENVWVRDIEVAHFGDSAVVANPSSKWVTVSNVTSRDPVSVVTGERRYTFDLSGEQGFVTNSSADQGRHDFVNNSTRPAGPNVFHNSTATNAFADSGPHQRWASGTLFDNITVEGDAINIRNRGSFGTTHGWTGSNMVVWNSQADSFIVQNPPTSQNWLIGSKGTIVEDTTFGPQPSGHYDQSGPSATPVTAGGTTSLYEAQLNDSADVVEFRDRGISGNWTNPSSWKQELAPLDAYDISTRDYLIGDIDNYTYDGASSVDNVPIDLSWQAAITGSSALPITKLDDSSGNKNVAFTMQHTLDPGERVVHAWMALAMKRVGGLIDTDFIRLFDMNPENRLAFSALGWDTELNTAGTYVGVLDLGTKLEYLQTGNVNVQINDDAAVDWALYTATVATPLNNPSAVKVILDGGGEIALDSAATIGQLVLGGAGTGALALASTGKLTIDGTFTQSVGGMLQIEISGTTNNLISAGGDAQLAGLLDVTLSPDYEPAPGDQFTLLTADLVIDTFDDVHLPIIGGGLNLALSYAADAVELTVLYAADFNRDGSVDADDLATWQTAYGVNALGDANNDGKTDGRDFLIWQRQFGSNIELGPSFAAVPEPSGFILSVIIATVFMGKRRLLP